MGKKELIMDAALAIFSKDIGIRDIKISDISSEAQIGKGTVYEYFNSKEEIFSEATFYFLNKQKKIFFDSVKSGDFKTEFISIMECINSIVEANRPLFNMLFLKNYNGEIKECVKGLETNEIKNIKIELLEFFSRFILKGQEEGKLSKSINAKDVTFAFLAVGTVISHFNCKSEGFINEKMSLEETIDFCYEKFVKILG